MYPQNQSTLYTNAVSLLTSATLRAPGASGAGIPAGQFGLTLSGNLPVSATFTAFASGGTFLGSAQERPTAGYQTKDIGTSYRLTTDGGGAITNVVVAQSRPNGSAQEAAVTAPINPGAGPNMGVAAQTIIFNAASITSAIAAAGLVSTDGNPITGALTVTLAGTDLQRPFSGGTGAATDGVYEADLQSGAAAFGLYIDGAAGGSSIKVELAAAPPNQTITLSGILQGTTLDGLFRKVYTTDAATTATTIIALY